MGAHAQDDPPHSVHAHTPYAHMYHTCMHTCMHTLVGAHAQDDPPLAELLSAGDKALLLVGGRPGRGNESFKTHDNTAPAIAETGEEVRWWWWW